MKEGRNAGRKKGESRSYLPVLLLGLCLCILALRVSYTESPTAQTSILPMNLTDTIYSLTLSGLFLLAVILWFLRGVLQGRWTYHVTGMEIGLLIFLVAGVVSTWGAADKRLALSQNAMLLGPIFAALLLVQILRTTGRTRVVLIVIAAMGILSAYQCIEQFAVSNQITIEQYEKAPQELLQPLGIEPGTFQHFLFEHRLYSRGVRGFFTTSNSAASFAMIACFAAFALTAERIVSRDENTRRSKHALYPLFAAAILIASLLLTQSKGGIVGFLIAGFLWVMLLAWHKWPFGRRKPVLIGAGLLCVLVTIAIISLAISYGFKHGRLPGGNSMLVRWQYWAASSRMIADHPLVGVGPGNFAAYYTRYKPAEALESVADPHCFLLSLLAQYGPLGLIGFLLMVFVPLGTSVVPLMGAKWTPLSYWFASKRAIIGMWIAVGACLLLIRPILMPIPSIDTADVVLYNIVALYVAPVAAFLIGFALLVLPLETMRADAHPHDGPIVMALGCAVLGVLVHNLIDFALFEPGVWTAFWITVACVIALRDRETPRTFTALMNSTPRKALACAVAAIVLGAYLGFVWSPVFRTTTKIQQAQDAISTGQLASAHRLLDTASEADSLSAVALGLNGNLYLQQYDDESAPKQASLLEKAVDCFRKATQIDPADYKSYEKLGIALSLSGRNQEAYDSYATAVRLYPGSERLWLGLAQAADRMGQFETALKAYRKTVGIEDAFRKQFHRMYPKWNKPVSRLGETDYQLTLRRIKELSTL
jgi:cytochrome c-type biogenesis protein CcmH/NrfG